jgi:CheY-like chemotaxis protein
MGDSITKPVVLIVDDEQQYVEIIGAFLENLGLQVSYAYDAGDALFRIRNQPPDLILLDVMMPEMDGLTLIGRVRLMFAEMRTPIVVVSAKTQPEDQQAAIHAGADDFLPKPFTAQRLKQVVQHYLRKH